MTDLHCCIRVAYAKRIISLCTCFRIFTGWSCEVEKKAQEIRAVATQALPLLSVLLLKIFKFLYLWDAAVAVALSARSRNNVT